VLRLDSQNQYALANLEKLYEEQHQWRDAYATRQKLANRDSDTSQTRHQEILAFLENELGLDATKRGDLVEARRHFRGAVELDARNVPAYLNLGDLDRQQGDLPSAIGAWERLVDRSPERAYLAFARLETAYQKAADGARFPALCRRLIDANPQDWRARLALARHLSPRNGAREALELLFEALVQNPHALALHQAIWQTLSQLDLPQSLVNRYVDLTRDSIFYLDAHICVRCRYRSTELLWQCPHCHEWNTFVEERIAPAKDNEATLTS
jgi:lipopolysaccharide biosynthesis regulator YciM